MPVFPLWAIGLDVAATVLLSFGHTRYRTTFEVSLVLLAAVQLDWLWAKVTRRPAADAVRGSPQQSRRAVGRALPPAAAGVGPALPAPVA